MDLFEIAFPLPLSPEAAARQFPPLDTWLRLNPQWSVLAINPADADGAFRLHLRDEATEQEAHPRARFSADAEAGVWQLELEDAETRRTMEVRIEAAPLGCRLVYREAEVAETERTLRTNLALWHRSTVDYILLSSRRTVRARLFKFLLDRVWLRMSQPGRRLVFFVIVTEVAALALFILWLVWTILFG